MKRIIRKKEKYFLNFKRIISFISKPLNAINALIIGVAIGLAPIWYSNFLNEPQLEGRIIAMSTSNNAFGQGNRVFHTLFISIANKRDIPVSVIDYEINLIKNGEIINNCIPFYITAKTVTLALQKKNWRITLGDHYLLNNTDRLISKNNPISGYLFFNGGIFNPKKSQWDHIELILYDAFGNDYKIISNIESFRPQELLPLLIKEIEILDQ